MAIKNKVIKIAKAIGTVIAVPFIAFGSAITGFILGIVLGIAMVKDELEQ